MLLINILHGSSCVGKSTYMQNSSDKFYKVEMDDTSFWNEKEEEWPAICIEFLVKHININKKNSNKNMIVTCGGLPIPNHIFYKLVENDHRVLFKHTLILCQDLDLYKHQIEQRKKTDIIDELLESYKWRENTKDLYNEVIIRKKSNWLLWYNNL
jgi:hypothetical protein